jgi:hypothetical protein
MQGVGVPVDLQCNRKEGLTQMNVLGLKVSVDRSPSARVRWTRRAGVLAIANVAVLGGGVAFATWSANGTGSGAAKAGTVSGVTAVAAASVSTSGGTLLFPGGSAPAVINVANGNGVPITVSALTIGAEAQPDAVTGGSGCTAANSAVSLSAASPSGLSTTIPANGTGTIVTGGSIISMGNGSNTGCQGATFVFNANISVTAGTS